MSQATLQERVARLERLVEELKNRNSSRDEPGRDDWRSTVGMFAGDPVI